MADRRFRCRYRPVRTGRRAGLLVHGSHASLVAPTAAGCIGWSQRSSIPFIHSVHAQLLGVGLTVAVGSCWLGLWGGGCQLVVLDGLPDALDGGGADALVDRE